jgi:cytochrome oxidase Cu insertion factor (SCO1/SenC/PrrC family)
MNDVPDTEESTAPVLSAEERSEHFKRGPPALPRKLIWIAIAIVAVLGIGGAFADSSFNVVPVSPHKNKAHDAKRVPRTLAQFVNLRMLAPTPAPSLDLLDQSGRPFSLRSLKGMVVALTFLDPACRDICRVEAAELREAAADLDSARSKFAFVIIDANPHDVGAAAASSGLSTTGLSRLPDAYFLSGTLAQLDRAWSAYGITVEYVPSTGLLAHTNLIDIINPSGRLVYSLAPFGNESKSGAFTLATAQEKRFASGIARYLKAAQR